MILLLSLLLASGCKTESPDSGGDGGSEDGGSTADGGADGGGDEGVVDLLLPLGDYMEDVAIPGGVEQTFVVELDQPGLVPELSMLQVHLAETAEHVTFTPSGTPPPAPDTVATAWARVGPLAAGAGVCQTGECWGSFTITSGPTVTVEPDEAEATVNQLQVISTGQFALCIGVFSPVGGTISASHASLSYQPTPECTEQPGAFAGSWNSQFTCTDCQGHEQSSSLTLTIEQTGDTASYSDTEGGSYSGTICGDSFTFSGGGPGWTESGHMVLTGTDSATKSTSYDQACCPWHCEDTLTRAAQ